MVKIKEIVVLVSDYFEFSFLANRFYLIDSSTLKVCNDIDLDSMSEKQNRRR